jgi:hypothetical protein
MSSFNSIQKTDDDQLYKVIIFKWIKNEKGEEQQKVVVVNQDGKVAINNQISDKKINIKSFTKGINKFIKTEKLVKVEANNDPPRVVSIPPKNGEQSINITIIKLKDFENEKGYENNSQYYWSKIKKSSDVNIDLYKYLQSDDLATLKKIFN